MQYIRNCNKEIQIFGLTKELIITGEKFGNDRDANNRLEKKRAELRRVDEGIK